MADTGWKFPGTGANRPIASQVDWGNPGNVTADDGSTAAVTMGTFGLSDGLAASNFDFSSIPAGSTIDGIETRVGDYASFEPVIFVAGNLILADDSDGSVSKHTELAEPSFFNTTDEMGGAAELWTETPTRTDVTDVDWGFFVAVQHFAVGIGNITVDFMQMKVYYTAGAAALTEPPLVHSFAVTRATNY